MKNMRIGIGIDFHRFSRERKLILGGVEVPHERGLDGHSDADVLLHAICDALLGAAALGDIGRHFPDSDPRYKNISSLLLLAETKQKIASAGFQIENLDTTIIAEQPKLAPYISEMRNKIAATLGIAVSQINIKATTAEGMGAIGRAEGIAVWATALLSAQRAS
ncbi:MAG: 2-C-methyl-D-erythritol 2,4-cyclodiphosphate synthase [Candidatus Bipolaricaulota bacterium]|nr:2-C-methyl-D-erythritol 2,4-cyclodiphosphate synthase [Candidatus Bipolaricaulota bacterium]